MTNKATARVTGRVVAGVILVALGVVFLLDNFGIVDAGDVFLYWPLILIGLGLTRLLAPRRSEDRAAGVVLLVVGSVFLARELVPGFRLRQVWPAVLLVAGGALLWQALRGRKNGIPGTSENPDDRAAFGAGAGLGAASEPRANPAEAGAVLREFALMGGGERVVRAQDFRGGEVTAIMGGFQIDLRGAGMAGDSATIEVFTLFGGVEFRVPQEWDVVMNGTPILGMFTASATAPHDGSAPAKKLIIRGTAIMGGVEAKN